MSQSYGSVLAYSGSVEPEIVLLENGSLGLKGVSFDAWQGIVLPRQWDDPEKSDPAPDEALFDFAERIAQAMKCLRDNLTRLVKGG